MNLLRIPGLASLTIAASLVVLTPGLASATAVFSSSAQGTLTITDITGGGPGLFIDGVTFDDPFEDIFGNANASSVPTSSVDALDPLDMMSGEGLSQLALSDGDASGLGIAIADTFTDGEIFIDNQSASMVTVSFSFAYDLGADVSVMDPVDEFAFATASFELLGESLDAAGDPLVDFFELVESDSDLGGGLDTLADTILFDVTLAPGGSDFIVATVEASGVAAATATVPESSTLALLAIGLAGLVLRRRE